MPTLPHRAIPLTFSLKTFFSLVQNVLCCQRRLLFWRLRWHLLRKPSSPRKKRKKPTITTAMLKISLHCSSPTLYAFSHRLCLRRGAMAQLCQSFLNAPMWWRRQSARISDKTVAICAAAVSHQPLPHLPLLPRKVPLADLCLRNLLLLFGRLCLRRSGHSSLGCSEIVALRAPCVILLFRTRDVLTVLVCSSLLRGVELF